MKLTAASAEKLITTFDYNIKAILIYGPDRGQVLEFSNRLGKTFLAGDDDPMAVVDLEADKVKESEANLFDEMYSLGFMNPRKLIKIKDAEDFLSAPIAEIVKAYDGDNLLILTADNLAKSSSLRSFFEYDNSGKSAVLACYNDDVRSLEPLLKKAISEAGKTITSEALRLAVSRLGEDRATTRMDIEKLLLYTADKDQIDYDDVALVVGDSSIISFDTLSYSLSSGNQQEAFHALDRLIAENNATVTIIRGLIRHYRMLYDTLMRIEAGVGASEAIKQIRPPVFFKNEPALKKSLAGKSSLIMGRNLARLAKAEIETKQSGDNPAETILYKLLLDIR